MGGRDQGDECPNCGALGTVGDPHDPDCPLCPVYATPLAAGNSIAEELSRIKKLLTQADEVYWRALGDDVRKLLSRTPQPPSSAEISEAKPDHLGELVLRVALIDNALDRHSKDLVSMFERLSKLEAIEAQRRGDSK